MSISIPPCLMWPRSLASGWLPQSLLTVPRLTLPVPLPMPWVGEPPAPLAQQFLQLLDVCLEVVAQRVPGQELRIDGTEPEAAGDVRLVAEGGKVQRAQLVGGAGMGIQRHPKQVGRLHRGHLDYRFVPNVGAGHQVDLTELAGRHFVHQDAVILREPRDMGEHLEPVPVITVTATCLDLRTQLRQPG